MPQLIPVDASPCYKCACNPLDHDTHLRDSRPTVHPNVRHSSSGSGELLLPSLEGLFRSKTGPLSESRTGPERRMT